MGGFSERREEGGGAGAKKTETPPQDLLPALAWKGGKPRACLSQVSQLSAEPWTRS